MSSALYKEYRLDMSSLPPPPAENKKGAVDNKKSKHHKSSKLANMGINIHRRGEKGDTPDYQVTQ
jgi:hypothetical protein